MANTTGGGATHIATATGTLRELTNTSNVILVAGGGGGGLMSNDTAIFGADAGGISGSGNNSGNQSSGYMFGQGEYSWSDGAGAGGGLYGGSIQGGAGSGFIRDNVGAILKQNKKMVGFNTVPTSDAIETKTIETDNALQKATQNSAKIGNGFVKIVRLEEYPTGCRAIKDILRSSEKTSDSIISGDTNVNRIMQYSYDTRWQWNSSNCKWATSGGANMVFYINKKFKKGNATKLTVHYDSRNVGTYRCVNFALLSAPPTSYYFPSSYLVAYVTWNTVFPDGNTIDLVFPDTITSDTVFYFMWHSCDAAGNIYDIYFDAPAIIVP